MGRNQSSSRFEVLSLFLPGWLWPGPSWSESGPTRSQAAAFSSLRPRPPLWPLVIFVSAVDFPPRRDMCGITGTCHEDKECTQFHRSHFVDWAWIHILRQSCVPCDDKVDGKERKRESGLEWFCVFLAHVLQGFFFLLQPLVGVHQLFLGLVQVVLKLLHLLLELPHLLLSLLFNAIA